MQGTISIGDGSQFEFLPDSKGRQRKFRVLDSQTQVPYEICTPDVDSLQLWNNGIRIVSIFAVKLLVRTVLGLN